MSTSKRFSAGQRGFAPILIVVLLAIAALGGGYLVYQNQNKITIPPYTQPSPTPTSDPTIYTEPNRSANWKTYINKEYGYSVQYPTGYEVIEAKPRIDNQPEWTGNILIEDELQKVIFSEEEPVTWQGNFEIKVLPNGQNFTLEEWAKSYFRPLGADPTVNLAKIVGDVTISGQPAKKFSIFSFDGQTIVTGTIHNNYIYHMEFTDKIPADEIPDDPDIETYQKVYDQILSTFRFLDQKVDNKSCKQDSDCALLVCSGCFNKDFAKTAPPDLACIQYEGYTCKCVNNKCLETK